jgi:hypothetical protein
MENQIVREIELKKQSLKRYRKYRSSIRRLEKKIYLLDERIKSVKTPNYSATPRGGTPITVEDLIADKLELEERLERFKAKAQKAKREILSELDELEDDRYSELLETYYIDCIPFETISENMGYTERHIYRLFNEAISALVQMSTNIET